MHWFVYILWLVLDNIINLKIYGQILCSDYKDIPAVKTMPTYTPIRGSHILRCWDFT